MILSLSPVLVKVLVIFLCVGFNFNQFVDKTQPVLKWCRLELDYIFKRDTRELNYGKTSWPIRGLNYVPFSRSMRQK